MIHKLKYKFIALSMTALFVLLTVIVAGMNIINYTSVVNEADMVLSILSQNKGMFPDMGGKHNNMLPPRMSPETPYESRYFTVFYDEKGIFLNADINKIASVDAEEAINLAEDAIENKKQRGFIEEYRYDIENSPNGTRITFLDCGRKLDSFYGFLISSIAMSALGFIIVFIIIIILSGRIIKPISESYEKQRQFITDAGHEIKTPLTVINANVDILEMELCEDNESLADIKGQVNRLKTLTDDLIMLSRMEEGENGLLKIDFPISEVVSESASPFKAPAVNENKEFILNITPMLTLNGNDKAIRQLTSILLDNALKYSPDGGKIEISLTRQGRYLLLSVVNTVDFEIKSEQLEHIFDRFYRTDGSRSSETGGHGIGLSVAKAIVTAHGGKIWANSDRKSFTVTASFPV